METLLSKMKEYLKMDSEIPFAEFRDYYQQVMDFLQSNYDGLGKDDLITAKFILNIVSSNSKARALKKGSESKKYRKMGEKTSFWSDAINFRLLKEGMTQQAIDEAVERLSKES